MTYSVLIKKKVSLSFSTKQCLDYISKNRLQRKKFDKYLIELWCAVSFRKRKPDAQGPYQIPLVHVSVSLQPSSPAAGLAAFI